MMRSLRTVAFVLIGALLTLAAIIDREPRLTALSDAPALGATPVAGSGSWFCAGGSAPGGIAAVGLEVANRGQAEALIEVTVVRSDSEAAASTAIMVPAQTRIAVSLADLAAGSEWIGSIVEVTDSDVVVEQIYEGPTGTDRASCVTTSSQNLVFPDGATRLVAHGEQMVMLIMNPFQEAAVVDVRFDSDVGPDSIEALVVPARRVVAVDVTTEVTVASRITAEVVARSGRVIASRVQVRDADDARGLSVTPAVARPSAVSLIASLSRREGVVDRVHVANPSDTEIAEVDLEIITDGGVQPDPIELTVRPGRTVVVNIAAEVRLDDVGDFALLARSLGGVPVAVSLERQVAPGGESVPGSAGLGGVDSAATEWTALVDGVDSRLAFVNPSATAIATVLVETVDPSGTVTVAEFELGPRRRHVITSEELVTDRPLVVVHSTAAIVVSREIEGFTSRQLATAVAGGEVSLLDLNS